jgi:hypothetical protein
VRTFSSGRSMGGGRYGVGALAHFLTRRQRAGRLREGGCTSNCSASCAIVRSFFRAARATFALKAGVWFRRARFFIFAPDSQAQNACRQAEIPLNALFKIPGPPQRSCCGEFPHVRDIVLERSPRLNF